jgi:hypothetical protein
VQEDKQSAVSAAPTHITHVSEGPLTDQRAGARAAWAVRVRVRDNVLQVHDARAKGEEPRGKRVKDEGVQNERRAARRVDQPVQRALSCGGAVRDKKSQR